MPTLANAGLLGLSAICLACNAAVDNPEIELAFESTPEVDQRDFFQSFVKSEGNDVREARFANPDVIARLFESMASNQDGERLHRAASQYRMAMDSWRVGYETMALAHLWMAVEALTKVQLRKLKFELAISADDALAAHLGVKLKELDATIRRDFLLNRDIECYSKAKDASDGLEHGFMPFADIHANALEVHHRLAAYVRGAVFRLCGLVPEITSILLGEPFSEPIGNWPLLKFVRGTLVGKGDELARADNAYPIVEWRSRITSTDQADDGSRRLRFRETLKPQLAAGISLALSSIQIWRGGSPINLGHVTPTTAGEFHVEPVVESQSVQIGTVSLSMDDPLTEKWIRPIASLILNVNTIRHMALYWIHKLGGERPYEVPNSSFQKIVERICETASKLCDSPSMVSECESAWAEALALDEIRDKVSRAVSLPEGLVFFDDRANAVAPMSTDVTKFTELNDRAVQLARRLSEILSNLTSK